MSDGGLGEASIYTYLETKLITYSGFGIKLVNSYMIFLKKNNGKVASTPKPVLCGLCFRFLGRCNAPDVDSPGLQEG